MVNKDLAWRTARCRDGRLMQFVIQLVAPEEAIGFDSPHMHIRLMRRPGGTPHGGVPTTAPYYQALHSVIDL